MLNPQIKSGILTILEKWDEINQAIKYKSNTHVFSSLVNRQIIMFFPIFGGSTCTFLSLLTAFSVGFCFWLRSVSLLEALGDTWTLQRLHR